MRGHTRVVALVLVAALALSGVAAGLSVLLGSDDPSSASSQVASPDVVRDRLVAGSIVLDVRTPEEYAAGHVTGAVSADLEGGAFDGVVADLPRDASYVVYCATGRRAAIAVDRMLDAGFTEVVNAGGLEDLTALGATTTGSTDS